MIRDPLELPFDQYQRYRVVADLLSVVRDGANPLVILDVGGRTANLRSFLPKDRVHLVDVDPSDEPGLVLGDGARLPFKDRAFDVVAAFDTLEHVPPAHRDAFVAECARVAKSWIVLAGPYASPAVDESERLLQRFLRDKLGVEHRYLDEHRHNGLPDMAGTRSVLEKAGARTSAIGHGNLERWLPLMCLSLYLDHEPELRGLAKAVFRFYNGELYASDHAEPVYRHAVVGALGAAKLPTALPGLAPPRAPAGVLARFDEVVGEFAAFDRARSAWTIERERLWEMAGTLEKDLAGHRDALVAERASRTGTTEVVRTLEEDLAGHRAALTELRDELARTRSAAERTRAELDGELALARAAAVAAERARDDERAARARLENQVDRMAAEAAALRADLDGHRATLAAEREDLAATRKTLETERADLAGHRAALAEQRAALAVERERARGLEELLAAARERVAARENDVAASHARASALESEVLALRAVVRDLSTDLDGHRGALRDTRADADRLRHDLEVALHERNVEQQRLEGAHGELARVARILQEQDRVVNALRGELRSRAKSLRRALGPKRPTA